MNISTHRDSTPPSLHDIHDQLTGFDDDWPSPRIDVPPITDEQRRRARNRWSSRVRASYVTAGQAATIFHQLIALGAPVELLSGAAYTAEELMLQLSTNLHILRPLRPPSSLNIPSEFTPANPDAPSWDDLFEQTVEFVGCNLAISHAVYRALHVVSSDHAISELSGVVADNLGELRTFGCLAARWMASNRDLRRPFPLQQRLPTLLRAYESLCGGGPDVLDDLAGLEITVETRPGNLGTLPEDHRAAIFYDTLQRQIFPFLDQLGLDGSTAWKEYSPTPRRDSLPPVAVAGIGTCVSS